MCDFQDKIIEGNATSICLSGGVPSSREPMWKKSGVLKLPGWGGHVERPQSSAEETGCDRPHPGGLWRGGLRGGDPAAAVVEPQARDRTPARVAASSSPQIPESQKPRENQQTPLSS